MRYARGQAGRGQPRVRISGSGLWLSPWAFDRAQSEARSRCLRFLPKSTPEAEARGGAGASLGGLKVRQGDRQEEVGRLPLVAMLSVQPQERSEQNLQ